MARRIGPRMREAVDFVARNPGYATVHRAIKAGLIEAKPGKRAGTYSLTVAS